MIQMSGGCKISIFKDKTTLFCYLVVVPVYDGEGRLLSQVFRQRSVMEEGLGALPGANLSDAADVEPSPVPVLLRRLPAQAAEVGVQSVEPTVNSGVGADLLQLTAALHEGQAVCCTAHLGGERALLCTLYYIKF